MFKVILGYCDENRRKITLHKHLTEKEAQAICHDPESSWKTCTKKYLKERTRKYGIWFLRYTEE